MKRNKRLTFILGVGMLLLLIPFIAMQFSSEVNWTGFDFLVAALLLFGTGLILEFTLRKVKTPKHRLILLSFLILALLLLWAELAVGIFNSPIAGS